MKDVILYSTGCPRCFVLKQKLNDSGIEFTENNNADQMLAMGMTEVPILEVDGERMRFTQAVAWINGQEDA